MLRAERRAQCSVLLFFNRWTAGIAEKAPFFEQNHDTIDFSLPVLSIPCVLWAFSIEASEYARSVSLQLGSLLRGLVGGNDLSLGVVSCVCGNIRERTRCSAGPLRIARIHGP